MFDVKKHIALSFVQTPLWKKADLSRTLRIDDALNGFNKWIQIDKIYDEAISKNIKILTPNCPEYPPILKTVTDFPVILFCKGDVSLLSKQCFAAVGSRNITSYGKAIISRFIPCLLYTSPSPRD